ncbi:MAG: class I SAM-dependent methyltransferase [Anaerolineae bacterium]|nr:class I SAM-dependent methyltransferase [Gemmatimonadaceae bacterium]
MSSLNPNVEVFNRDVEANAGYLYTTNTRLSSRMATDRSTDAILETAVFKDRLVLDMGCGDGFYTVRFFDRGAPRALVGADAANQAIAAAASRADARPVRFVVADAHRMPFPDDSFDVVLVQSILHHDDDPGAMIREAFRLAPTIVIHEPNGNNFGLKLIEKLSPYHREHNEKSYSARQLSQWIENAGGFVSLKRYAGFVPMFSPDSLAKVMKVLEPVVERLPVVNALACAVCVLVATRQT